MSRRLTPLDLAEWRTKVGHWRQSGLSATDYARYHGLSLFDLRWWDWYIEGRRGPEPSEDQAPAETASDFELDVSQIAARAPEVSGESPRGPPSATPILSSREVREEALELIEELRRRRYKDSPLQYMHELPTVKQREFLALETEEALFGGAAGGGKSSCLLMAALQYVHIPNYAAIIFRRTYADLAKPGSIMDRAHVWLRNTDATWREQKKEWTFPSGAKLAFGYLDVEKDKYNYQGSEFGFIGFDELTQFPEKWYLYLFSRLRKKATDKFPLRMRNTSNPGGIGHKWVKERFIDARPGPNRPVFVPSLLSDNPHIDQAAYLRSLEKLDATTRKQLLEGLWVQDSSSLVYRYIDERMGIAQEDAPECDFYVMGVDYGFTDETAFTVFGWCRGSQTVYVLESRKYKGLTPHDAAEIGLAYEKRYRFDQIVGDVGGLGKGYAEEARQRFSLPIEPAQKTNKAGYIRLAIGAMERGDVLFVRETCQDLITEMAELPWREDRLLPEDGFDDHCTDSFLYGYRAATAYAEQAPVEPTRHAYGSKEYWDAEEERMLEELEKREGGDDEPYWDRFPKAWEGLQ